MQIAMKTTILPFVLTALAVTTCISCNKSFIETPPNKDLQVPATLGDIRKILDNEILFSQTPSALVESGDEFYFSPFWCSSLSTSSYNIYTWAVNVYNKEEEVNDWSGPYMQVFYANQALGALKHITTDATTEKFHHELTGTALFYRAYAFYFLVQEFSPVFDSSTMQERLGIPLPVSDEVNNKSTRTSVETSYKQMLSDLQEAATLLPDTTNRKFPNRPSKAAAYAMLARVYLSMGCYQQALAAADSCLQLYGVLIDYNEVKPLIPFPFTYDNAEILYQSKLQPKNNLATGFQIRGCFIDSVLCKKYEPGDLRPGVYFTATPDGNIMTGSYYGNFNLYSGLATDEVYLIRAECRVRLGATALGIEDLNMLLQKRWKTDKFTPYLAQNQEQALDKVLEERQKELLLRGLRWTDLRRLNKEGKAITLSRKMGTEIITLPPGDLRYTLPIPLMVIRINNMQQNPR